MSCMCVQDGTDVLMYMGASLLNLAYNYTGADSGF